MHEYHFSKLSKTEQGYYRKIIENIKQGETTVKAFPFMGKESVLRAITAVNFDHPEFFYVNFRRINFIKTLTGINYQVNYLIKSSFREILIHETDKKIDKIVNAAHTANLKTDYEKYRWIHNFIVRNIKYNYDALRNPDSYPEAFNIRGVVTENKAVCEGISKLFKYLCDRLNLESIVVTGTSTLEGIGDGIQHAWNIVKIDDFYAHVDVTWDIGVSEVSHFTRFDYFCLSDEKLRLDHIYELCPTCETERFSYFSKRSREFKSGKKLQEYIDQELSQKSNVLYFRIDNQTMSFEELSLKVQQVVNKIASKYCNSQYCMEMAPNKNQRCFFFRVTLQ